VVISLLEERRERRSVSVSSQARAAEYELSLGVRFLVTDGDGRELVPEQWLERQRVFRIDRDNIVGSSEEQALLEREMQSDLVQQVLRTL
jgi:LPS-assembly lipoprotein